MNVQPVMEDVLTSAPTTLAVMNALAGLGMILLMTFMVVMVSVINSFLGGSLLSSSGFFFPAQPCILQLLAPQNGSIWCTGDQVTDQNCSFACDAGFTFTGSKLRQCLSNNSWTGVGVVCIPKHCNPLIDPPNGYVVRNVENDCGTVLTTACEIKCVEGYYINDTTPYYQTCVANQTSWGVDWSAAPACECTLK